MYHDLIIRLPLVLGDNSIPDLNSSIFSSLSTINPWYTTAIIISYKLMGPLFGYAYNGLNFYLILLMPFGMFFLLDEIHFPNYIKFLSSVYYALNPLTASYNIGPEYTLLLALLPFISLFIVRFKRTEALSDIITAGLMTFILFEITGISNIKYLLILGIPLLLYLFHTKWRNGNRRIAIYSMISLTMLVILSIPLEASLFSSLLSFEHSITLNSGSIISNEMSIVRYEFQSSNLLVAFMALPLTPGSSLVNLGYLSSWEAAAFLLLLLSAVYSTLIYKGERKLLYDYLLLMVLVLVIFQYGVYNGTFRPIYHFGIFDIYNYPNFFNIIQMIAYAIFIAQLAESITIVIQTRQESLKIKTLANFIRRRKHITSQIVSFVVVITIIMVSFLPMIEGTAQNNKALIMDSKVPNYLPQLVKDLQGVKSRTLILPNDVTTLVYLDAAIPYTDAFGFPYNYEIFANEFPSTRVFSELSSAFINDNVSKISEILVSQNITHVVVLNPGTLGNIVGGSNYLEGGGLNFSRIMDNVTSYQLESVSNGFLIYVYHSSFDSSQAIKNIKSGSNINYLLLLYNIVVTPMAFALLNSEVQRRSYLWFKKPLMFSFKALIRKWQ